MFYNLLELSQIGDLPAEAARIRKWWCRCFHRALLGAY